MSYGCLILVQKLLHDDEDKNIEMKKSCTDCKTTKTPLWRGGPAGPKVGCSSSAFCSDFFFYLRVFSICRFLFSLESLSRLVIFMCLISLSGWVLGFCYFQSLCNACGIRYRKKRRAMLSLDKDKESEKKKKRSHSTTTTTTLTTTTATSASSVNNGNGLGDSLKMSLIEVGEKMMFERSSIVRKQRCQRRRRLGEEEQAAFSLMALSCGSVLA